MKCSWGIAIAVGVGCGAGSPGSTDAVLGEITVSGVMVGDWQSASRLQVAWEAPSTAVDHYVVLASAESSSVLSQEVAGTETESTLEGLRSATTYDIVLRACFDAECTESSESDAVPGTTPQESWSIVGTGAGYENATPIIADGNTMPNVMVFGSGGPNELFGYIQLYYNSLLGADKGVSIGLTAAAATSDSTTFTAFTRLGETALRSSDTAGVGRIGPATFQVVPLRDDAGTNVRIFFEGEIDGEAAAQVYWIDSVDGLTGRDFHPGEATQCAADEITFDGPCTIALAVGAQARGNPGVESVRQAKVAYPALEDWRWDGGVGTPMFVTLHLEPSVRTACDAVFFNAGYAVWDGSTWVLQYDESNECPLIWPGVQAPMPVHLGGTHYALYFNHNLGSTFPATKPMKVLYGDAARTGDPDVLEFEDWETIDHARDIEVLWPDGTMLEVSDESRFDDHVVFHPTSDPDIRAILTNMSCPEGPDSCGAFIGAALLQNP